MAEIASVVAVVISLAALWLANSAQRQAESSFREFTEHLIKNIRDAQVEFSQTVTKAQKELKSAERTIDGLERSNQDAQSRLNTMAQRLTVIEHELKSLTSALPPKYREALIEKRAGGKN